MKRFVIAAAFAVILGLGTSGKASAQIVYGYSAPVPGGVATTGTVVSPTGYTTFDRFYSPFNGVTGDVYGTNIFGQSFGRSYAYNPWTNLGYRSGFYQPNYYAFPFGGYTYGGFYRRW
jgi:hypothetical protein